MRALVSVFIDFTCLTLLHAAILHINESSFLPTEVAARRLECNRLPPEQSPIVEDCRYISNELLPKLHDRKHFWKRNSDDDYDLPKSYVHESCLIDIGFSNGYIEETASWFTIRNAVLHIMFGCHVRFQSSPRTGGGCFDGNLGRIRVNIRSSNIASTKIVSPEVGYIASETRQ